MPKMSRRRGCAPMSKRWLVSARATRCRPTAAPHRGIGAARAWAQAQFRAIGAQCGGCLTLALPEASFTGKRLPTPTKIVDVVAIQRGSERPDEVVIVAGHIDSRVSDVMDITHDAPGANDDGSGTALVIEAARVLSQRRFPSTIVYAVLSGEEQGLYGGKVLADYAKARAGVSKPCSTTTSWAIHAARTGWLTIPMCASSPKGRAPMPMRR
jgi:hypothetical protein